MLLTETALSTRQINAFKKKNIETTEDVIRIFPKRYHDYSATHPLYEENNGCDMAVRGTLLSVQTDKKNGRIIMKAKILESETNLKLTVVWIGASYLYKLYKEWIDQEVIVGGKIQYNDVFKSFSILNPILFDTEPEYHMKIYKENRSIKGISDESLNEIFNMIWTKYPESDKVPREVLKKFDLMDLNTALHTLHEPVVLGNIEKAKKRIIFDKLLYFAISMNADARNHSKGTSYNLKSRKIINQATKELPYELTEDQQNAVNSLADKMSEGKRIDVLLQGDVGYGKTIVVFLLMLGMAESGYQSVMLAPLQQLARQHYVEISAMASKFGINVAYIDGSTKVSEKKKVYADIESGKYSIIVGTHSIFSDELHYNKLAFIAVDEEQKFGVEQQNKMYAKAVDGFHRISMSATPMPRTITDIIFDNSCKEICNIKTRPKEKLDIKTRIFGNANGILRFMEKEIENGHQCYSVCPLIDKDDEKEILAGVKSTEEIYKEYCDYFANKGISVAMVTGKTSTEETERIFNDFRCNKIQVMVSTTVIEVGINVPNATVIVINNAERFGLATLHQLRGRVGRGKYQSYCILNSTQTDNSRLNIIQSTIDGFKIAEEDCRLRGTGNILGTEQSGNNEYIELVMEYPNMYEKVKKIATDILDGMYT